MGLCGLIALGAGPLNARIAADNDVGVTGGGGTQLPPYLQCVPYARSVTGIQIRGDAWTWWDQAEGRYARGYAPRLGAVLALRPHRNSHLGHVAAVSRIVDARTILLRHANWSPINGRRGQIEDNVTVTDVSSANDWSAVRVWYGPIQALGGSVWPVQGFIYSRKLAPTPASADAADRWPARVNAKTAAKLVSNAVSQTNNAPIRPSQAKAGKDPIGDIISQRMHW